jgi:tetratricopeptide (TPR) repeat protein
VTWILLGVWTILISFGIVSIGRPKWLTSFATRGRMEEAAMGRHLGDNAMKRGDLRRAIAEYRHSLEIYPEGTDIQTNLGIAYVKAGEFARGRSALQKAAAMEPTPQMRTLIALSLGDAAQCEKRMEEAIRYYGQAESLGARPDLVYQRLGLSYLAAGDLGRARSAFERSLEAQLDPEFPYRQMIDVARGGMSESSPQARRWAESAGSGNLTEKDWARFDSVTIRQMHETDPEIAKTHNHLGLISYRLGDRADAIRHFEKALAIWPDNADARRNLQALRAQGAAG